MTTGGKRCLCALFTILLILTMLPQAAQAADVVVDYIDSGGVQQTATATQVTDSTLILSTGWYVVDSDVTTLKSLAVTGDIHLILADGAAINVYGDSNTAGIRVSPGNSLTIYGQAGGTGRLCAQNGGGHGAGIGGSINSDCGTVTINGGAVKAVAIDDGAGIGGGLDGAGGTVTINGGTVMAIARGNGAGIGGGSNGDGGTVTINGGSTYTESIGGEAIGYGHNGTVSGTLQNGGGTDVYLTTVTLGGLIAATSVVSLTTGLSYTYGTSGMVTDNSGRLYLYLPDGTETTAARTTVGSTPPVSKNYAGSVTTTGDHLAAGDLYPQPEITDVTPAGTDAPLDGNVIVTFDQAMNSGAAGIVYLSSDGGTTHDFTLTGGSWSAGDTVYTAAYTGLSYGTEYTVVAGGFPNVLGTVMETDSTHSFTTKRIPYYGGSSLDDTEVTITTSGDTTTIKVAIKTKLKNDGTIDVTLDENTIIEAIEKALKDALENGADNIVLEIIIRGTNTATGIKLNFDTDALGSIKDGVVFLLNISTPLGDFSFDAETLKLIDKEANGDIAITVAAVDRAELSPELQAVIGGRPAYDFTITSGDKIITDFGGGTVTVSLPYTLAEDEENDKIIIYYLNGSGEHVMVPNCTYDAAKGVVIFLTYHFSTYAVAYNDVSFSDVSGWYEEYVGFLSAREIINGTGYGKFSPESNMTRAQAVTILYRLSGDYGSYVNPFADVSSGAWYKQAAAWAYENGITSGVGGSCFAPENEISREQLMVMLYNYAKYKGDMPVGEDTNILSYHDALTISEYAYPALQWACGSGIMDGDTEGNLNPAGYASRAQVAKIMTIFIRDML